MAAITYFCDLAADFLDTAGDPDGDGSGAVYTGPGGFQAAIRGNGNATALLPGDILYLKGTADLSTLVKMDCDGTDVSHWAVGDVVRNLDGSGDNWTGVVVQEYDEVATGLAATDICLVQLDTGATYEDVDVADGIENTTQAESVDPLAAVTCVGIEIDTNSGDTTTGNINFVGCDASWVARADQAVLDGKGADSANRATQCIYIVAINYLTLEHLTFTNAAADGVTTSGAGGGNSILRHCLASNNTTTGFDFNSDFAYSAVIECIADTNGADGFSNGNTTLRFVFCRANGNTSVGIRLQASEAYSCLSYGNTGNNFQVAAGRATIFNCVADGSVGADGIAMDSNDDAVVIGCRITNNDAYGIDMTAAVDDIAIEDWNVFFGNDGGGTGKDMVNIKCGLHSYGDSSGTGTHPLGAPGDDGYTPPDYNVADGKEIDSTEIDLFWDA